MTTTSVEEKLREGVLKRIVEYSLHTAKYPDDDDQVCDNIDAALTAYRDHVYAAGVAEGKASR